MGKIKILFASLLLLVLGSCTEEITPTPYEYTKVFTGENSKTWKLRFIEYTLDGAVEETFNETCTPDDRFTFYAGSERAYRTTTGSIKCYADESDVIHDTWSFNNASATLTMIIPYLSESSLPFIVREARKSKLELEIFFDEENSASYRIHFEATDED